MPAAGWLGVMTIMVILHGCIHQWNILVAHRSGQSCKSHPLDKLVCRLSNAPIYWSPSLENKIGDRPMSGWHSRFCCSHLPNPSSPSRQAPEVRGRVESSTTFAHNRACSRQSKPLLLKRKTLIWPYSLRRPTFAVRQGGPGASSMQQNGEPALACTALVGLRIRVHRQPISCVHAPAPRWPRHKGTPKACRHA